VRTAPIGFERHVTLEGCFNFRDLGSYPTVDGRWVLPERLYRADGPHALTEQDAETLRTLALATVIDLRTPQEVDERGCFVAFLDDVVELHLPMIDVLPDTDDLPMWTDPEVVAARYRTMLAAGAPAVAEALVALADDGAYPAMFHCSAGKDRTGILSAVVLGTLGVPDETIVADYALSAAAMHRLLDHYRSSHPDAGEQLERVAPAMVAAHPEAMASFLAGVRRDFGSFDEYAEHIGAGDAPARIRSAVVR
jgi:protein-tyrosine phosphatase